MYPKGIGGYLRGGEKFIIYLARMSNKKEFLSYFLRNLLKGFIYLLVLIGLIVLIKSTFKTPYDKIEHLVSDNYLLMLIIFLISEFFVGIIPPELFMIWTLDNPWYYYLLVLTFMTFFSLLAGWLNYCLGCFISKRAFFMNLARKRFKLEKYQKHFDRYGSGLIIVAALTPMPFALISLLTGTLSYPQKKYLIFASFRIIRFVVYGILVWNLGEAI